MPASAATRARPWSSRAERVRPALRSAWLAAVLLASAAGIVPAQERAIPLDRLRSGASFAGDRIRAQQADDFSNPAMLWVERGGRLWSTPAGQSGQSCAGCHGDARASMKGVAARYPVIDKASGRLFSVEDRVRQCRGERQQAAVPAYESEELLSLSSYVGHQSRGMPVKVDIDGPARERFEAGRTLYYTRIGQMNMACSSCHEANWGRRLYAETISQGHPNAYPIYRLEWQATGSLERRLRSCFSGVRAELLPYGAPEARDLMLYLAWRAEGLAIETPGVRR